MLCARLGFQALVLGHKQGSKVSLRGLRRHLLNIVTCRVRPSFLFVIDCQLGGHLSGQNVVYITCNWCDLALSCSVYILFPFGVVD